MERQRPSQPDHADPPAQHGGHHAHAPTLLRAMITERHWQKFTTFERQFRQAAQKLADQHGEPELAKVTVSARQFERWYSGKVKTEPYPDACRILEFMFGAPVAQLLAPAHAADGAVARLLGAEDVVSLTEWLTATSISDEAIAGLDRAAVRLAEAHAQAAPVVVLAEARQVQACTQALLRGGKQRHRQARELLRINGGLLTHISLLLSDLGDDAAGEEYGNAALLYLRESGASEVTAWYVLAKIARWRHQYLHAADLARQGLDRSSPDPMRVQLACYEANAAALLGDTVRARSAMRLAEGTAAALPPGQMTISPWSFPAERMTMFRLSVALGSGDPDGALNAASAWDACQAPGRPHVPATWAQIRVGAAIARLRTDALDGTAEEIAPMLTLPPEFRIATVTGWLDDLSRRLAADRYARNPIAADLQEQIRDFSATAASARHRTGTATITKPAGNAQGRSPSM